jgi:carboxylesterase
VTRRKREPFEHSGGENGILLLHGFSGSPFEVRELGARLHRRGYSIYAPELPGHGGDVRVLGRVRRDDYLEAAEALFDLAQRRSKRVYVVGFSLGGALGLHIAQRRNPAALVTINSPVFMPPHVAVASRISKSIPLPVNINALFGHAGYVTVPASALATFLSVLARVRRGLHDVRCPLLVLHSARDTVVPVANASTIADAVSSPDRRVIILSHGPHLMTVGTRLDAIEPLVAEFLERMDRGHAPRGRISAESSANRPTR